MFSLVIIIISIALVIGLVAATSYHGGDTLAEARANAEAARLKTEEQHLLAAADAYQATHGRWPQDIAELVSSGILKQAPPGVPQAQAPFPFELIPSAHAQAATPGWRTLVPGQPIYATSSGIDRKVCRKFNLASRADDGILDRVYTGLSAQCYGSAGQYAVLVLKSSAASYLPAVIGVLQDGPVPSDIGHPHWDVAPRTAGDNGSGPPVVIPTDPDLESAALELSSVTVEQFGEVMLGASKTSIARTLRNTSKVTAQNLQIEAPFGFLIKQNTCGQFLSAEQQCAFSVEFSPTSEGPHNFAVTITSTNAQSLSYGVSGLATTEPPAPKLTFDDSSAYDFGEMLIGQQGRYVNRTLRNEGNAPATDVYIWINSPFTLTSSCGAVLEAGEECPFAVWYAPHTKQYANQFVFITSNEQNSSVLPSISISGAGTTVPMTLSPSSSENFGNVPLDQSTLSTARVLTNKGNHAIEGLKITGDYAFTIENSSCSSTLAAGQSCSFSIRFTPSGQYQHTSTIQVTSVNGDPASISVSGFGNPTPKLELRETGPVDFGAVAIGSRKLSLPRSLMNSGTGPLIGLTIQPPSGVTVVQSTCTSSIPAGQGCHFQLEFSPYISGALNDVVTVSAVAVPSIQFEVIGRTAEPEYTLSSWTPERFGQVTIDQAQYSNARFITNTGSTDITGLSVTGPPGVELLNGCNWRLAPGQMCSFQLKFAPRAPGALFGLVQISADMLPPRSFEVSGEGVGTPSLSVSSLQGMYFGEVVVGSTNRSTVRSVTNNGLGSVDAIFLEVGMGFQIVNSTCSGIQLHPNQSCEFAVEFIPGSTGSYSDFVMVIAPNAQTFAISVSGTGI